MPFFVPQLRRLSPLRCSSECLLAQCCPHCASPTMNMRVLAGTGCQHVSVCPVCIVLSLCNASSAAFFRHTSPPGSLSTSPPGSLSWLCDFSVACVACVARVSLSALLLYGSLQAPVPDYSLVSGCSVHSSGRNWTPALSPVPHSPSLTPLPLTPSTHHPSPSPTHTHRLSPCVPEHATRFLFAACTQSQVRFRPRSHPPGYPTTDPICPPSLSPSLCHHRPIVAGVRAPAFVALFPLPDLQDLLGTVLGLPPRPPCSSGVHFLVPNI